MLQISISSDLAAEHPRFMAECAERGRAVEVFDATGAAEEVKVASGEDGGQRSAFPAAECDG